MQRLFVNLLIGIVLICSFSSEAKVYLVSVGIADYSNYPRRVNNLRLTVEDAKTIANIYSKNGELEYYLLLNEKATKENIVNAISSLFTKAGENDIAVFFFSGHGYPGGFCASNGNIGYESVRTAMAKSKCKNKMMFVDACRAGGIRDRKNSSTASSINSAKNANVLLFLSSRTNENSIERRDMANGFFTTFLQKGLRGNADANRDRIITAKELFNFVHEGVTRLSGGKQHPVMWGKFNDNMPVMRW